VRSQPKWLSAVALTSNLSALGAVRVLVNAWLGNFQQARELFGSATASAIRHST
jgi:hypothetical protein